VLLSPLEANQVLLSPLQANLLSGNLQDKEGQGKQVLLSPLEANQVEARQ